MEEVNQLQRDLWERYRDKSRYPDPEQYQRMMERQQRERGRKVARQAGMTDHACFPTQRRR